MKLSIYIPTLKCDALFDRCQASIRKSIPSSRVEGIDYEIIVVENVKPLSEARNEGMRRAKGDWLATIDADDMVTEDWFPEIWNAIEKAERTPDIDDIVFDNKVISPRRSYIDSYGRSEIVESKTLLEDMLRNIRIGSYVWRHVMHRRIFGDFTFKLVPIMEDYISTPKLIAHARKVLYVPKPLYLYIIREDSISSTAKQMDILDIAVNRAREYGAPSIIGASRIAYDILYNRVDENGIAQRWIRRHVWYELTDPKIDWKWRLKFLTAFFGFIIRRPR